MRYCEEKLGIYKNVQVIAAVLTISCVFLAGSCRALGGGPKFVAGVSFFNPGVKGVPVHWAGGQVRYFVDQGALNDQISNSQATAMVDAAAAIWSAVPTAAVNLVDSGQLAEDVNGSDVLAANGIFQQPADITPNAASTPVAVVFDADGQIMDALLGSGGSQPDNCSQNGVLFWVDAMNPDATMAHGIILLNGRCATSPALIAMMGFQLERAFGRILGLDFSQVNDGAQWWSTNQANGILGWPVMQPVTLLCGPAGGSCLPNPSTLRTDDVASLSRIYPVNSGNAGSFSNKLMTAVNTVSIQGTIRFRSGSGMQGVNVVARPLDANGSPMPQFAVTFVSGSYFCGNHGNPVTGWIDVQGNRLDRLGSDDPTLQGYFDLSAIPIPAGMTSVSYQLSFEAVNSLYIQGASVGPYGIATPIPSGILQPIVISGLQAGFTRTVDIIASGSTTLGVRGSTVLVAETSAGFSARGRGPESGAVRSRGIGSSSSEAVPRQLPASGFWSSRLAQVNARDWFLLPVRGNRLFTVVTQALNESGLPSSSKALPALGVWDGFSQIGSTAAGWTPAANGAATGETWLQVATAGADVVRLAVADQRGDGRPDYMYRGWILYADMVYPARLPAGGGTIVIQGMGFRAGDTVKVGGVPAQVIRVLPNQITAQVASAAPQVTGPQDVEVDDLVGFNALAVIPGGVSYDASGVDSIHIVSAPSNQVPLNVPQAFAISAQGSAGSAAGGISVLYTVASGSASLACGQPSCVVATSGDGRASMSVTATSSSVSVVTASLTNGSSVQAHFFGGPAGALAALTPTLYIAAGATLSWPVQAIALSSGIPSTGQQIVWQSVNGILASGVAAVTGSNGIATSTLSVGPLLKGQSATTLACLNLGTSCVTYTAFGARPEFATLSAISGISQSVPASSQPAPILMRALDMNGNPLAGATVTISQALYAWSPPCSARARCAQAPLLARQVSTGTSSLDGTVGFPALTLPGVASILNGVATTGNFGAINFSVEQRP